MIAYLDSERNKIFILLRSIYFGYCDNPGPLMGPGSCSPLCAGVTRGLCPCLNILLLRSEEFGGVFPVFSFLNWIDSKFLPFIHSARCTMILQAVKSGIFSALAYAACIGGVLLIWMLFWLFIMICLTQYSFIAGDSIRGRYYITSHRLISGARAIFSVPSPNCISFTDKMKP